MAMLLVIMTGAVLSDQITSNILLLLVGLEGSRLTGLRQLPRLAVGYFDTTDPFTIWLEKRITQPEVTLSSASIVFCFGYFIFVSTGFGHPFGTNAFVMSLAGFLVASRRPQIAQYVRLLRRTNWRWRYHDRSASAPTFPRFTVAALAYGAIAVLSIKLSSILIGEPNSNDEIRAYADLLWVPITAGIVLVLRCWVFAMKSRTSILRRATKHLVSVNYQGGIGLRRSAVRAFFNVVPLPASYGVVVCISGLTDISQEGTLSVLLTTMLLLYGIASLIPIIHPGGRTGSDILAGTRPVSQASLEAAELD